MVPRGSIPPYAAPERNALRNALAAILFTAALVAPLRSLAQEHADSFQLKPRQSQTLTLPLKSGQVARVQLHLNGGIVGVREKNADGASRPLWLIDLGRGANPTYVATGTTSGNCIVEITSFERERPAELSVEAGEAVPESEATATLREAEDLLANAELLRRRWPGAPKEKNAPQLYDNALALAGKINDIPLQRLILTQKARYLTFGGHDYTVANALLESAVGLPSAEDAPQQALAWKTLSSVRYDLGEYLPAIAAGQAALRLYRQTGDVYWQGIVLGNLASVYSELGENTEAVAAGRQALQDAEAERDIAGVVYCLSQLADLYQQQGDLESALRTFYQGLAWVSDIRYAPLVEAEIQKDLGGFYAQIGNWEQASQALRRYIEIEKGQSDPVSLEARGLLATVMQHQGKLQDAVNEDSAAIAMAHALALKQDEAHLLLKRASIYLALRQHPEAIADIGTAQALGLKINSLPLQIEAESAMGDALLAVNPEEAEESYRKALQLAERAEEREEQSLALAGLAKVFAREGRWENAADSIEAALKIVENSRGNLSDREMQVTYFSLRRNWYELAVDICMRLNQKYPTKGYDLLAFSYTERARARSLLDTLDSSGYIEEIPLAESLREEYARNRRAVAEQQALLSNASESDDQAAASKLRNLDLAGEGLESKMRAADERLSSPFVGRVVTVAQIQRQLLAKHSAMLSYWIGASRSYRWLITPDSMSLEELPPRDQLQQVVLPLEHMLQSRRLVPVPGENVDEYASRQRRFESRLETGLARAGSTLLSDVPESTDTILVVGDGCLSSLPFAALRISKGAKTDYALRKYSFLLEPSASVAVYLKQHPAGEQAVHIAIFADPVFSPSDPRLAANAHSDSANSDMLFTDMPRLTGSAEEAQYISQYVSRRAVTLKAGFDATPDQVRNLSADEAVILHFATHTVALSGRPEATGIALSMWNREGKRQDGVFWLKDIYALHLPSALVVLSGCDTNRRQSSGDGEGLNNLAYAFFFSGAHAVIGSLWAIDDIATSRMMDTVYRDLLRKRASIDAALRSAQLTMLSDPHTKSPAMWASFVVEGWLPAYSLKQSNGRAAISGVILSTEKK